LGFLGGWPFRYETPVFSCLIFLDFLAFSRPNRDLSMSYAAFSQEKKSRALFAAAAPERGAKALGHSDGAGLLIPQA
jgi:hypothetical protein